MYVVVGCPDCSAFWIVGGDPDTTACPRCDARHQFRSLKRFAECDDEDAARAARGALLARRSDHGDGFDAGAVADAATDAGLDDDEYLAAAGLDPELIPGADDSGQDGSTDAPREVVTATIVELAEPSTDAVIRRATDRGLDPDRARTTLEKLRRAGRVVERDGALRVV